MRDKINAIFDSAEYDFDFASSIDDLKSDGSLLKRCACGKGAVGLSWDLYPETMLFCHERQSVSIIPYDDEVMGPPPKERTKLFEGLTFWIVTGRYSLTSLYLRNREAERRISLTWLIEAFGGIVQEKLTANVTHTVGLTVAEWEATDEAAIEEELNEMKKVTPYWIQACIDAGRIVPIGPFLYSDACVPTSLTGLDGGTLCGTSDGRQVYSVRMSLFRHTSAATGESRPHKRVRPPAGTLSLAGRRFFIDWDFGCSFYVRESLRAVVEREGGVLLGSSSWDGDTIEADAIVKKYRSGEAYVVAARGRKPIGTLQWLLSVLNSPSLSSALPDPKLCALHYPTPPIPSPLSGFIVSLAPILHKHSLCAYVRDLVHTLGGDVRTSWTGDFGVCSVGINEADVRRMIDNVLMPATLTWLEGCLLRWSRLDPMDSNWVDDVIEHQWRRELMFKKGDECGLDEEALRSIAEWEGLRGRWKISKQMYGRRSLYEW